MSYIWIVRLCNLFILQIATSLILIYKQKKKISYIVEIFLSTTSIIYAYYLVPIIIENVPLNIIKNIYKDHSFTIDKILLYIAEYIIFKIILLILIWGIKYFSFYALVSISKKNGKIVKIGYKLCGKKQFIRFSNTMWNKVDYGIRIKKGIPKRCNKKHQETKISFDKDGFPKFKPIVTVKLNKKLHKKSREVHFTECNKILSEMIQKNKKIASKFTKTEIQSFKKNVVPPKYTWHHHQDKGVMQLVDRKIHASVNHRGGFSIWGKREKD